jgi:hypothetical protein
LASRSISDFANRQWGVTASEIMQTFDRFNIRGERMTRRSYPRRLGRTYGSSDANTDPVMTTPGASRRLPGCGASRARLKDVARTLRLRRQVL